MQAFISALPGLQTFPGTLNSPVFFRRISQTKNLAFSIMTRINLAYFRPIVDIQGNIIFANNGNVVVGYQAILPEIYSLSEKDFEDIHNSWFQSIKSLPTGCVVHKQDIYVKRTYSSGKLPNNSFLEKATHRYFKGREYIEPVSYTHLTLPTIYSV